MSDYTIKNLKDLEDVAAGRATGIEARMGRGAIEAEQVGVSYFRYAPGTRAPYGHRHQVQEEAYIVVSGSGRVRIEDEINDVKEWDVNRVAPTAVRGFEAGPDGLELVVVGGPRPAEGDGDLVHDWWTD